ncbi:hypothetical protein AWC38_SpisGene12657 [Stylophora pistillata]|uniref:Uncharacterized protein n=1 Tax=Stylophora pistillata TaxID=50429 RepID=A0A2B4S2T3_STYPI|nr:hypothetical protein AWC38_SpisGene12657 [Stylophora pistillata]
MSGIITAVFEATIGWLADKGRDKATEKLEDGDVTDHQFRAIIMREMDEMKSKLDGLPRKDLLASISFFREGIELLYEAFGETKPRIEYRADTAQAACVKAALSLTKGMRKMELTEPVTRKLASAKKKFKCAREKATEVFSNEALSTSDRILSSISTKEPLPQWPMIDTGEEKFDILRDGRVTKALRKQGMKNCSVLWMLGQDGEEEHKINKPRAIATNSSGQYIVADHDLTFKVFDNSGEFVERFRLPPPIDDSGNDVLDIDWPFRLATDINDDIYVTVKEQDHEDSYRILKFNKAAEKDYTFPVRKTEGFKHQWCKLSVSDSGKVMVLRGDWIESRSIVDVYETDGQFVCRFGEQIFREPWDITTLSDEKVMVVDKSPSRCVHIFSEQGEHLKEFDLHETLYFPKIAFHREIVAGKPISTKHLFVGVYTKDDSPFFELQNSARRRRNWVENGSDVNDSTNVANLVCRERVVFMVP